MFFLVTASHLIIFFSNNKSHNFTFFIPFLIREAGLQLQLDGKALAGGGALPAHGSGQEGHQESPGFALTKDETPAAALSASNTAPGAAVRRRLVVVARSFLSVLDVDLVRHVGLVKYPCGQ